MTQQIVNIGTNPNDGTGDNLRTGMTKVNSNFTDVYSQLSFTQAGTGAVARSVQSKLQDIISVKDFGATGNGTTDDTVAIQKWINYLQTSGIAGFWNPGNYKITSSLNITSKVNIKAERRSVNILLATQNMNGIVIGDGTGSTKTAVGNTVIHGLSFNPFPGVAAFSAGACMTRNNVQYVDIQYCDFYGLDSGTKKLFNGLVDFQTVECDAPYCTYQQLLGNGISVTGSSGVSNRAVDCNYDNSRFINIIGDAVFWGANTAGLGIFRPEIYATSGWGIHINSTTGSNGQNYFITDPDIEMDGTGQGIYVQGGGRAVIRGGWIGTGTSSISQPLAIWFGANASSCEASTHIGAGQIKIDGPANSIIGGEISGDSSTTVVGITVNSTATDTIIGGGVRIRQFTGAPISFVGAPTRCLVDGVQFRGNGADVAGLSSYTTAGIPPVIKGVQSDAAFNLTAASNLPLLHGRDFIQVTGATAINTMTALAQGSRIIIQAGSGGITINNSATLITKSGSSISVPAFKTLEFVTDGQTWFESTQNF